MEEINTMTLEETQLDLGKELEAKSGESEGEEKSGKELEAKSGESEGDDSWVVGFLEGTRVETSKGGLVVYSSDKKALMELSRATGVVGGIEQGNGSYYMEVKGRGQVGRLIMALRGRLKSEGMLHFYQGWAKDMAKEYGEEL